MIIDGGPRKNFNTASMLQKFAEGAMSVSDQIEVKMVRLYGMNYKGCMYDQSSNKAYESSSNPSSQPTTHRTSVLQSC